MAINPMPHPNDFTAMYNPRSRAVASETESAGIDIDAVYADAKERNVSVDDFLQLMIAQLSNQDFMNPTDDSEFLTQMAQFSSMQQMQELAGYSKSNYMMSLLGKEVTLSKVSLGGNAIQMTGIVEKVSLNDEALKIFVEGASYDLSQIVSVQNQENIGSAMSEDLFKAVSDIEAESEAVAETGDPRGVSLTTSIVV